MLVANEASKESHVEANNMLVGRDGEIVQTQVAESTASLLVQYIFF